MSIKAKDWAMLAFEYLLTHTWTNVYFLYFYKPFYGVPHLSILNSVEPTSLLHRVAQFMTAPASAVESKETSGGVTMETGSLASVSMECRPGSVTGCSAVNNDLVVYAAQECCNVWEYSTQSSGGEGGRGRRDPICLTSLSLE